MLTKQINTLARITILQRNQAFTDLGITGTQHSYILSVCRHPGITQDGLAKMLYVNKSNVARQVAQLCENGFLLRETSEMDKRAVKLYPTAKAEASYPIIQEVLRAWNTYLQNDLTDDETQTLMALMKRVVRRAKDYIGESEQPE